MLMYIVLLCFTQQCFCRHFDNPLISDSIYQPDVIKYKKFYYTLGSSNDGSLNLPIYRSSDLQNWEIKGYAFTPESYPRWSGNDSIYSPELAVLGESNFRIYFETVHKDTRRRSIGVAMAGGILGPYYSMDRPLLQHPSLNIGEPSVLNAYGAFYLLWAGGDDGIIYGRRLRLDGLSFMDDAPTELLVATEDWERRYLEAPSAFVTDEYYYIAYSHFSGCINSNGTGIARSKFALGPYEKFGPPILLPTTKLKKPEHPSILKDLNNEDDILLFHAYKSTQLGCSGPFLCAASLSWNDSGWPFVVDYP